MDRTFGADPLETVYYTYNNIHELTGVSGVQTDSYSYDGVGNRTTADSVNYTKNSLNQYTAVGGVNYSYDANGNLTDDGTNTYTYDTSNRLSSFTDGSTNANYTYDAFNRRVSKTVNGVTTYFIYDEDSVAAEYDGTGALSAEYAHGDNIDEVLTMERGGQTYYYFYDGLDSVTEITDATGTVIENYTYDAYGNITSALSSIGNPFYFIGRRFDDESSTYYFRARTYNSQIGRFHQRDPLEYIDSMNLYEYAFSNPVNWVDPYGEQAMMPGYPLPGGPLPGGGGMCPLPGGTPPVDPQLPDDIMGPQTPTPEFQIPPIMQSKSGNGGKYGNSDENVSEGHRTPKGPRGGSKWNQHTGKRSGGYEKGDDRRDKHVKDKKKKRKNRKKKK